MHFARDNSSSDFLIRSYSAGCITVGDTEHNQSLILTPERLISGWEPDNPEALQAEHFVLVAELEPEVVLLGTGKKLLFPHPAITADLLVQGIGVEVMDTAAACRTYNVLLSESRRVVAALLL